MKKIKVLIEAYYTTRDVYGNVYWAVVIVNPKNGKSFVTSCVCPSNVEGILYEAFNGHFSRLCEMPTDSKRLSSLPQGLNLPSCHFGPEWKAALNSIGFRLKTGGAE